MSSWVPHHVEDRQEVGGSTRAPVGKPTAPILVKVIGDNWEPKSEEEIRNVCWGMLGIFSAPLSPHAPWQVAN